MSDRPILNPIDVWREVAQRIGFFTKETRDLIPEAAGFYGWFLPLWVYDRTPSRFMRMIENVFLFDPSQGGTARAEASVELNWDHMKLTVDKVAAAQLSPFLESLWTEVIDTPALSEAFQRALMQASILLPPLYVGKADNLRDRYGQHVDKPAQSQFHSRFLDYSKKLDLQLAVADLLFVCIQTPFVGPAEAKAPSLHLLLEQVVMRLSRPPYSIR